MEQILLTILIIISLGLFVQPIWKRLQLIAKAKGCFCLDRIGDRIVRFLKNVLFQQRVISGRPGPGFLHALVYWGFLLFMLETFHHFSTCYGWHPLGEGAFHRVYGGAVAIFAILVIIGISGLAFRRFILRPEALGEKLSWSSGLVALFIEILMVTYLLDYFELIHSPTIEHTMWWIHSLTILAFIVLIPHSKHIHLVLSPFTTFLKDFELARIHPLDFENDEFGAEKLSDFSAHTTLGALTCVECGRCFDQCPASQTGKALSPKQLMLDLRAGLLKNPDALIIGPVIDEEIIWQCTTCGACTFQCPVGIDQVVPIIETRRGKVAAAEFPSTLRPLFDNLEKSDNPWKYPRAQADDFIEENSFPIFKEHDVLYWMGCMGRYDFAYQKVALAVAKILTSADIRWGILKNEKCTGDAARRAGNELVFQMLAEHNIEILNNAAPKLILTTCPHCLRTLQEYRDIGLNPDIPIVHHAEYFTRLVKEGRITLSKSDGQEIVYHDACYLSRYIGGEHIDYPRRLISQTGATLREPDRNRERSFCCGAGGGLLFTEETAGERVNHNRVKELLQTGASAIGTTCPFCQLMLRDGLRDLEKETIAVKDIAELMAEHLPA